MPLSRRARREVSVGGQPRRQQQRDSDAYLDRVTRAIAPLCWHAERLEDRFKIENHHECIMSSPQGAFTSARQVAGSFAIDRAQKINYHHDAHLDTTPENRKRNSNKFQEN